MGRPWPRSATVGRPTWWLLSPAPWNDLQAILAAARKDSGPVETWQATAMWGASALAPDDPSRMAVLIAGVCFADASSPDPASHAAAMLRIGADVAAQRKARPPAGYLSQAGAELAAQASWPTRCPSSPRCAPTFMKRTRARPALASKPARGAAHSPSCGFPLRRLRRERTYGVSVTANVDPNII